MITDRLFPSKVLSFYEVLVLLGLEDNDSIFYSEVYNDWAGAVNDPNFQRILESLGYDMNYASSTGLRYFDLDERQNVEICLVRNTEVYSVSYFQG